MKLYGIKNCNSVKKALDYLNQKNLKFEFCDIKKIDENKLDFWLSKKSFTELLNTASPSARKLNINKENILTLDKNELKRLILSNPSCIKRPVIEHENKLLIGKDYEKIL